MKPRLPQRLVITGATLATLALAAAWVIAWIPAWPCTLFEHFRVQYAATGVIIVGGAAALRLRGYFDLAAIALVLHVLPLAADLTTTPRPAPTDGVAVRVLVLNVLTESARHDAVRRLIADERPDVIGLVEVDQRWLAQLAPALAGYGARIEVPRPDNFGMALYARRPLTGEVAAFGTSQPSIVADVALDGAPLRVLLVHPVPPISRAAHREAAGLLAAVADRARASALPVLVMGDFNATPWSRPFARLVRRSGLCDSRAGFGLQASFPAASFILRIPIDHVLASCSIGVRDRRIGRDVGSDHLPVIVDLVIPRSRR